MEYAHFDFVPFEPRGVSAGEAVWEGPERLTQSSWAVQSL